MSEFFDSVLASSSVSPGADVEKLSNSLSIVCTARSCSDTLIM